MGEGSELHLIFNWAEMCTAARVTCTVTRGDMPLMSSETAMKGTEKVRPMVSQYEG